MVCPKCGADCSDANFCPRCGYALRTATVQPSVEDRRKALEAAGEIFCPRCLSTSVSIRSEPDLRSHLPFIHGALGKLGALMALNHRRTLHDEDGDMLSCIKCGYEWRKKAKAREELYNRILAPVLKKYTSMKFPGLKGTFLRLDKETLVISLSEMKGSVIPLKELAAVEHCKSSGYLCGMLSVRDRSHLRKPFPQKFSAGARDRFSIIYDPHYKQAYCELTVALQAIIDANKKQGLF